jgi:DNA-binding NarL/FixJ family response regulator
MGGMPITTSAVELHGIEKTFRSPAGPVHAVRGVDIEISPGEVVALLGPNGAGKSTTIDLPLGLTKADAGTGSVFGSDPSQAIKEGKVAAMLQVGALLRDLSIRELVRVVASLYPAPLAVDEVVGGPGYLRRALGEGASGFLHKDAPAEELAAAIRTVAGGGTAVDPTLAAAAITEGDSPLTPREHEVLAASASNDTAADIAATLYLSEGTVRNYLSTAIRKLGARNRREASRSPSGRAGSSLRRPRRPDPRGRRW